MIISNVDLELSGFDKHEYRNTSTYGVEYTKTFQGFTVYSCSEWSVSNNRLKSRYLRLDIEENEGTTASLEISHLDLTGLEQLIKLLTPDADNA